jgi:hypothetical protein
MTKLTAATALAGILGCAAGAYYWAQGSSELGRAPKAQPIVAASVPDLVTTRRADTVSAAPKPPKPLEATDRASDGNASTPLRAGEVLDFAADVSKLSKVANLRLQIVERRSFFGKTAWHLQAFAHTENPLRMMFELDDQFDSYSDATTLSSLQYEMHLNERGQRQDSIQRMKIGDAAHVGSSETETRVLPGTRDPLGLMQYLRTVDWSRTHEVHGPVYDGHKLYDVIAKLDSAGRSITVPAGAFDTSKIDIRVFDAGVELKDASFSLYLANNPSRTPVLLEAVMPFATARVALTKVK